MLGLAFIIPAYKIFEDIKSRFGEEPLLCPSPSVVQPYNALNDGKKAEQPLVDLIRGKGTGTVIQRRGFPRVDMTVTAEVIAAYVHRASYSIDYGDLGEDVTKIEKNLKMILYNDYNRVRILIIHNANVYFITTLDAANWTRLKGAEQCLQSVVEEVPHGRAAFCGDNLLGASMIMTGTSNNQLMAATFNATISSIMPPSFGSIVPSIDAYTYIGCNQGTTSDAGADRIYEVHKTVVWKYSLRRAQ